jgi:hypothetical protein
MAGLLLSASGGRKDMLCWAMATTTLQASLQTMLRAAVETQYYNASTLLATSAHWRNHDNCR